MEAAENEPPPAIRGALPSASLFGIERKYVFLFVKTVGGGTVKGAEGAPAASRAHSPADRAPAGVPRPAASCRRVRLAHSLRVCALCLRRGTHLIRALLQSPRHLFGDHKVLPRYCSDHGQHLVPGLHVRTAGVCSLPLLATTT